MENFDFGGNTVSMLSACVDCVDCDAFYMQRGRQRQPVPQAAAASAATFPARGGSVKQLRVPRATTATAAMCSATAAMLLVAYSTSISDGDGHVPCRQQRRRHRCGSGFARPAGSKGDGAFFRWMCPHSFTPLTALC
eukprot:6174563-Pleurochrysis_carterae.AAC.1